MPVQFNAESWLLPCPELKQILDKGLCPELPDATENVQFNTYLNHIPCADIPEHYVRLYRFRFELATDTETAVMCNSPSGSWTWVDDEYLFGSANGRMIPSFHRCPPDQRVFTGLKAGEHTMIIALLPSSGCETIEFNIGLGYAADRQWMLKPFK
jgi:hypothetical protein